MPAPAPAPLLPVPAVTASEYAGRNAVDFPTRCDPSQSFLLGQKYQWCLNLQWLWSQVLASIIGMTWCACALAWMDVVSCCGGGTPIGTELALTYTNKTAIAMKVARANTELQQSSLFSQDLPWLWDPH